jgi:hypothetical protein
MQIAEDVAAAAPSETAHGQSHHQQNQKGEELKKKAGKYGAQHERCCPEPLKMQVSF